MDHWWVGGLCREHDKQAGGDDHGGRPCRSLGGICHTSVKHCGNFDCFVRGEPIKESVFVTAVEFLS